MKMVTRNLKILMKRAKPNKPIWLDISAHQCYSVLKVILGISAQWYREMGHLDLGTLGSTRNVPWGYGLCFLTRYSWITMHADGKVIGKFSVYFQRMHWFASGPFLPGPTFLPDAGKSIAVTVEWGNSRGTPKLYSMSLYEQHTYYQLPTRCRNSYIDSINDKWHYLEQQKMGPLLESNPLFIYRWIASSSLTHQMATVILRAIDFEWLFAYGPLKWGRVGLKTICIQTRVWVWVFNSDVNSYLVTAGRFPKAL